MIVLHDKPPQKLSGIKQYLLLMHRDWSHGLLYRSYLGLLIHLVGGWLLTDLGQPQMGLLGTLSYAAGVSGPSPGLIWKCPFYGICRSVTEPQYVSPFQASADDTSANVSIG